ncbi:MAG TPA: four helix bundle protein, partial [Gemmatimonadales bacterium]|nr:four helix bundle protein [Gemmatimonadales bacterium]
MRANARRCRRTIPHPDKTGARLSLILPGGVVNAPRRSQSVINGYRDLLVWQRAMDLVIEAYGFAKRFPGEERYALAQQLRRAAVSVPSNIAEGHGRKYLGDYVRHVSIARGSLMEMETQL